LLALLLSAVVDNRREIIALKKSLIEGRVKGEGVGD